MTDLGVSEHGSATTWRTIQLVEENCMIHMLLGGVIGAILAAVFMYGERLPEGIDIPKPEPQPPVADPRDLLDEANAQP